MLSVCMPIRWLLHRLLLLLLLVSSLTFTTPLTRYDVELVVCTVLGIAWLFLLGRTTYNLQNLRAMDWAIKH